jgi:ABC-2 type transport system permease protein
MFLRRSVSIARNEVRILRKDPTPLVILVAMPLLIAPLYRGAFRAALVFGGHPHASGDDFAIPAQLVMFGFFLAPYTGFLFFRDRQWGTWSRLRSTPATEVEIVVGKALPMLVVGVLQAITLLVFGSVVLDLHVHAQLGALIGLAVMYAAVAVTIGVALAAALRTVEQLNAFGFLGATLAGAIGGALVPLATLPRWSRHLAPITPHYWAMRGANDVVLRGRPGSSVVVPILALGAFATAFVAVAIWRFRTDDHTDSRSS